MKWGQQRAYLIAEIGSNHDGVFQRAIKLIESAADAGADAVKFQVYQADKLVGDQAMAYTHTGTSPSQRERFRSLQFSPDQWRELCQKAASCGVDFLASVFDEESADMIAPWVSVFKVASGDLTNIPLLRYLRKKGNPLLLSTGASTLEEIDRVVEEIGKQDLILLHCVASYPAPADQLHLRAITAMRERFGIPVGYSDHSLGVLACLGAVALGATVVEKHFTHDASIPTGDHRLSADATQFKQLAQGIRELENMLGQDKKKVQPCERDLREKIRRAVVAAHTIPQGKIIEERDLIFLRPQTGGIAADSYRDVLGKLTTREIKKDQFLSWSDLISSAS
jgi:N,N'-diacetyllegionaminate synthase